MKHGVKNGTASVSSEMWLAFSTRCVTNYLECVKRLLQVTMSKILLMVFFLVKSSCGFVTSPHGGSPKEHHQNCQRREDLKCLNTYSTKLHISVYNFTGTFWTNAQGLLVGNLLLSRSPPLQLISSSITRCLERVDNHQIMRSWVTWPEKWAFSTNWHCTLSHASFSTLYRSRSWQVYSPFQGSSAELNQPYQSRGLFMWHYPGLGIKYEPDIQLWLRNHEQRITFIILNHVVCNVQCLRLIKCPLINNIVNRGL